MKTINGILSLIILLVTAVAMLSGCGGKNIYLSNTKYNPGESVRNLTEYKDAEIYLSGFNNDAENTGHYNYYSIDESVTYETDQLIPDYIWYCFEKAFKDIGMKVNESEEAPALYLIINDMTDEQLKFDLNLYRGDTLEYVREFIVKMPAIPVRTDEDLALLERNAYDMIDITIAKVLNDNNFKRKIIKAPLKLAEPEKKVEGTLVGIVKKVNAGTNEVIVGSGKIADMINIGDTIYIVNRGRKIRLKVKFPMQTIARCTIIARDRKRITGIKTGDMVYK